VPVAEREYQQEDEGQGQQYAAGEPWSALSPREVDGPDLDQKGCDSQPAPT